MSSLYEVWEYRHGKHPRFRYRVEDETNAVIRFLRRKVFGGESFEEYLRDELGHQVIKICIKDAHKKGTKKKPNYPEVVDIDLSRQRL